MAGNGFIISDRHYMLFGRIVSNYARAEVGFRFVLGAMLHLPMEFMLLLSAPYTSLHLRNATKAVAKIVIHDDQVTLEKLVGLLGTHKSLSLIRNDISHNMWRQGDGDAIRPMGADIREGKLEFVGIADDDRQYSREDLRLAANKSVRLVGDLIKFQDDPAFIACVARNADLSSLDVDAILGYS